MAKYLIIFLFFCLTFNFIRSAPVTPDRGEGSHPNVFEPRGRPSAAALTAAKDTDESSETPILEKIEKEEDFKEKTDVVEESEDKKDAENVNSGETTDEGENYHLETTNEQVKVNDDVENEIGNDSTGEEQIKKFDDRETNDKNEENESETEEETNGVANLTENKQTGERDAGQEITSPHPKSNAISLAFSSIFMIFVFVF